MKPQYYLVRLEFDDNGEYNEVSREELPPNARVLTREKVEAACEYYDSFIDSSYRQALLDELFGSTSE